MITAPPGLLVAALLTACGGGSDNTWVQFNADDDTLEVEVTADTTLGDPVSTDLHSTSGAEVVGTATVDPGSGPIGTYHTITVDVADDYEADVGRVSVTAKGDRGEVDADLNQDSADHGHWWRQFESLGDEGEERTDTFTFHLYEAGSDSGG